MMSIPKVPPLRSKTIRGSARGEDCQIQLLGVCNHNPETTVLCHLNGGGGTKHSDILAAYGCSDCHDAVDGRRHKDHAGNPLNPETVKFFHVCAVIRTIQKFYEKGLITKDKQGGISVR